MQNKIIPLDQFGVLPYPKLVWGPIAASALIFKAYTLIRNLAKMFDKKCPGIEAGGPESCSNCAP